MIEVTTKAVYTTPDEHTFDTLKAAREHQIYQHGLEGLLPRGSADRISMAKWASRDDWPKVVAAIDGARYTEDDRPNCLTCNDNPEECVCP